MGYRIPFNRPCFAGNEQVYIAEAIANGHISGDGPFTRKCQVLLQEELAVPRAFLTPSCTAALEMAALLLDIGPSDEIIVPSFTFASTVNAFVLRGARIVFADIRPDTLNLDEARLDELITPRTKAIVPVHYAGVACDMERIGRIAAPRGIAIVEDNAHGLFAKHHGRWLGTFGCLAAQSFHETKNFTCGEGGALLVNDPRYIERAEIVREKGTDRSRFFRGQVDKYTWVDVGSSYLPSDVSAAFLYAQLEARERIQAERRRVWKYYADRLRAPAEQCGVRLPTIPSGCEQSYHMFFLVMRNQDTRNRLITHLEARGILSVFHYLPLHLAPMGRRSGMAPNGCPVAEDISGRLVRLPFYNNLSEEDQAAVCSAVEEVLAAV
jgi:dTDP-4-amino-4,6-dideoxygalactose transaminase